VNNFVRTLTVLLALSFVIGGCASEGSGPIKMYSGEPLPEARVVTLHPPTGVHMVLYVNGETPVSCVTSCMFYRAVQIAPGQHKFSSGITNIPTGQEKKILSKPPSGTQVHPIKAKPGSAALLWSSFQFEFNQSLEAGKHYQLAFGTASGSLDDPRIVWWQEIPSK
jgi:hypothetical protein